MPHVGQAKLHAYRNRAVVILVDAASDNVAADLSNIRFRVGDVVNKTGLTAADGGLGIQITVTLTPADTAAIAGPYPRHFRWECLATIATHDTPIADGIFELDDEPTEEPA